MRLIIFSLLCCLLQFSGSAQQKHALLVGINDYYEVFGIKSHESLRAPVTDVQNIRELLIRKFGVPAQNIETILNAEATRDHILAGLTRKLNACKPGDQMIFYYSGHGVWIGNSDPQMVKDTVKRGMSQAMLTSDLYNFTDNFKCFLRDITLKSYFNQFIDKKVTFTALMDCCFSGSLARTNPNERPDPEVRSKDVDFNELMGRLTENAPDTRQLLDSIFEDRVTPNGCKLDAQGNIIDNTDTDEDGVPDCNDQEPNTPLSCFPVNKNGIGDCSLEDRIQQTLNRYDKKQPGSMQKAFNGRQTVRISERDNIIRPEDKKESRFLFISAATDIQKALEFPDKDKVVKSLFTASIIRVLNSNPADLPADKLFEKIREDMAKYSKAQDPVMYGDPSRMKMNLIGGKKK